MGSSVEVLTLPECDFCAEPAAYDGRMRVGPWAYMCERHWEIHGVGQLGTGHGQRLILKEDDDG